MRYSILIPIHNERNSLEALYRKLRETMDRISADYEIIMIDDASTDDSVEVLKNIQGDGLKLTILRLEERSGMAVALQAGFDAAQGQILITMDGDMQNDPADIPKLLSKLAEGYDAVCGWRKHRKDPWSKKIASGIANGFRRTAMREKIHDVGCTFRAFKQDVVRKVRLSGGLHRYFTALLTKEGFKLAEVPVNHFPRAHGRSNFGFWDRFVEGSADLFRLRRSKAGELNHAPDYKLRETIKK